MLFMLPCVTYNMNIIFKKKKEKKGPRPLYCMHYNYMYCLIASRGGNVLCTLSLWACAYMLGRAYTCLIFSVGSVDRLSRSASLVICFCFLTLVGKLGSMERILRYITVIAPLKHSLAHLFCSLPNDMFCSKFKYAFS